jgi:hypothetical protein
MSTVDALPLTSEQIEIMRGESDADWLKLTPEQESFLRSATPGQCCMFYGDEILKMPAPRLEEIMSVAFKAAATAAFHLLEVADDAEYEFDCEDPKFGQMYVRASARTPDGKTATAIGMIPDPRSH